LLAVAASNPVLPQNSWPNTWHTWVVSSVTLEGHNASIVKGQLAVFDVNNQFTCRYGQENLLNRTDERPTDMCDFRAGFHYRLNDTSLYSKCDEKAPLEQKGGLSRWTWPAGLAEAVSYLGIDHIAQKDCDHFVAQNFNVSGTVIQMDVWTTNDTGFPCQISVFEVKASPRVYFNWAFDGFSDVIPKESLRCSAPQVVCDKPDWVCSAVPGTDSDALGAALQWVCGPENSPVDCDSNLNPGKPFFLPNDVLHHCDWAFNQYFQHFKALYGEEACSFGGVGQLNPPQSPKLTRSVRNDYSPYWGRQLDSFLREQMWALYPVDLVCG